MLEVGESVAYRTLSQAPEANGGVAVTLAGLELCLWVREEK